MFKGVYARDQFNNLDRLGSSNQRLPPISLYICNLDNSNEPGSHWVVIEFNRYSGKTMYFDPYGFPPIHEDIINKLIQQSSSLMWNNVQLQDTNTTVCGQYCTIYCLLRARDSTPRDIIDLLHCDGLISHDTRDHLVYNFIKNLFPNKLANLETNVHDINDIVKQ